MPADVEIFNKSGCRVFERSIQGGDKEIVVNPDDISQIRVDCVADTCLKISPEGPHNHELTEGTGSHISFYERGKRGCASNTINGREVCLTRDGEKFEITTSKGNKLRVTQRGNSTRRNENKAIPAYWPDYLELG